MSSVISAALAYLTSWFQSRHAMQLEILALRHQLAVYQNSVKRPPLQPADRLFWAWFSRLWSGWQHTLEFVQPRTVLAWQKKRFRDYWRRLSQSGKPGRPTLSKEVIDLIRDMWGSNPTWGSPRIVGELRKLGITVAKSTVEKYRPRGRKPPSPIWKACLSNHVKDLVACDFFTVPTVQCRVLFVFIMLTHDRRRIVHVNLRWLVEVFIQDWKGHEGWAQLTKQPGEEGARQSVILSLLVDHSLFVHPDQQAQLKNNLPAYTVGSLRANVQVMCLVDVIDDLVSSEDPQDQLKRFSQALHDVFAFNVAEPCPAAAA